jgi:hypothetical protein
LLLGECGSMPFEICALHQQNVTDGGGSRILLRFKVLLPKR